MDQFAELTNTIFDAGMVGKEVYNDLRNFDFKNSEKKNFLIEQVIVFFVVDCFKFSLCHQPRCSNSSLCYKLCILLDNSNKF